jgi:hypothetical protein
MRRVLIVFGVLASGTALSFGAAAAVFIANPESRMVPNNAGAFTVPGKGFAEPAIPVPMPRPMPMPAIDVPPPDLGVMPPDEVQIKLGMRGGFEDVEVIEADLPEQSGTQP